jgi:hypothetical protein
MREKSEAVDDYIEKQKYPQKEILKKVREIILETLPNSEEKMAWGVPVFTGGKFYIVALKDHVNVGFTIKGLSKKELETLRGKGKTMRHIKINSLEDIDKKKLVKLIKITDNNSIY